MHAIDGANQPAPSDAEEAAMSDLIGFAEVTGAILGALGLALGLEWATLNGLFRLMPLEPRKEKEDRS